MKLKLSSKKFVCMHVYLMPPRGQVVEVRCGCVSGFDVFSIIQEGWAAIPRRNPAWSTSAHKRTIIVSTTKKYMYTPNIHSSRNQQSFAGAFVLRCSET